MAKAMKEGGKFQTESRKLDDPRTEGTGKKTNIHTKKGNFRRGTIVTVEKTPEKTTIKRDPDKITPGKVTIGSKVEKSDMSENKVIKRETTMELGKKYKENPEKTKRRIFAQQQGKTSYDAGNGRRENSGVRTPTFEHGKPTIEKGKTTITRTPAKTDIKASRERSGLSVRTRTVSGDAKHPRKKRVELLLNRKVKGKDGIKRNKPTKILGLSFKKKSPHQKK